MSNNNQDFTEVLLTWKVPEFDKHERSRNWYIIGIAAAILLLVYALYTQNFLFAVIIILSSLVMIMNDGQDPVQVDFALTDEGIILGRNFYDYDVIKHFTVVYKPRVNVENLYIEFKSAIKPRLSIPLAGMDPLHVRSTLLKFLPEDLERTDLPLSEALSRIFKL